MPPKPPRNIELLCIVAPLVFNDTTYFSLEVYPTLPISIIRSPFSIKSALDILSSFGTEPMKPPLYLTPAPLTFALIENIYSF